MPASSIIAFEEELRRIGRRQQDTHARRLRSGTGLNGSRLAPNKDGSRVGVETGAMLSRLTDRTLLRTTKDSVTITAPSGDAGAKLRSFNFGTRYSPRRQFLGYDKSDAQRAADDIAKAVRDAWTRRINKRAGVLALDPLPVSERAGAAIPGEPVRSSATPFDPSNFPQVSKIVRRIVASGLLDVQEQEPGIGQRIFNIALIAGSIGPLKAARAGKTTQVLRTQRPQRSDLDALYAERMAGRLRARARGAAREGVVDAAQARADASARGALRGRLTPEQLEANLSAAVDDYVRALDQQEQLRRQALYLRDWRRLEIAARGQARMRSIPDNPLLEGYPRAYWTSRDLVTSYAQFPLRTPAQVRASGGFVQRLPFAESRFLGGTGRVDIFFPPSTAMPSRRVIQGNSVSHQRLMVPQPYGPIPEFFPEDAMIGRLPRVRPSFPVDF